VLLLTISTGGVVAEGEADEEIFVAGVGTVELPVVLTAGVVAEGEADEGIFVAEGVDELGTSEGISFGQ